MFETISFCSCSNTEAHTSEKYFYPEAPVVRVKFQVTLTTGTTRYNGTFMRLFIQNRFHFFPSILIVYLLRLALENFQLLKPPCKSNARHRKYIWMNRLPPTFCNLTTDGAWTPLCVVVKLYWSIGVNKIVWINSNL